MYSKSTNDSHLLNNPSYQVTDNQETFIHHDYEILNTVSSLVSTDTSHSVDNPFYQVENAQDTCTNHDYEIINNN